MSFVADSFDVLDSFSRRANDDPDHPAHQWRDVVLTRGELARRSDALAAALVQAYPDNRDPVVVHGHKHPHLLVCFLACVKAGHPYIPVDSSLPPERVRAIVEAAAPVAVLAVDDLADVGSSTPLHPRPWLEEAMADAPPGSPSGSALDPALAVGPDEPFYIIFTSGSTGTPKGVAISRRAVNRFTAWITDIDATARPRSLTAPATIINQAPFSFDLSVMDLMISLATGATLWSLDKDHLARPRDLHASLTQSRATTWVSTPSFADLCLAAPEFGAELMPDLGLFLFCGETLPHATAAALRDRFPGAAVVNTYGPTESTVAVTQVSVNDEILDRHPVLPVGAAKPGTQLLIRTPDGQDAPTGEPGEIVIAGDTVALGYYHRPDLTERAFGWVDTPDGERLWSYRTGDKGFLDEEGYLHFRGRLDYQVKLHGYRLEIEDIEAHLRALPGIQHALVVPRYASDGQTVTSLHAVVQPEQLPEGSRLKAVVALKAELAQRLPDYMIPKTVEFTARMPLTANGKADRAAVAALAAADTRPAAARSAGTRTV